MREETKKRLEQAIWRERAKKAGIGFAIIAAMGLVFSYENLDLMVTDKLVGGTVAQLDPLISKTNAADGEMVEVKLDSGQLVRVMALKSHNLKPGDKLQVTEHHHATGRVTHTLK